MINSNIQPQGPQPQVMQLGVVRAAPVAVIIQEEKEKAQAVQNQPVVQSLASYIRKCWMTARDAKMMTVEPRMLMSLRQRRGEYEQDKLAQIRDQGGSEIYAMLTSVKCRAAASWLRDILIAEGDEKPWTIKPSNIPEVPPQVAQEIVAHTEQVIMQQLQQGAPLSDQDAMELMGALRDAALAELRNDAVARASRMEDKMEDQLNQGGFLDALNQFIDDITTFPAAIIKGPIVRKKPRLKWMPGPQQNDFVPQVEDELVLEWERVDPFMIYPSPAASTIDDGWLIERHRMARSDLEALIGVDGYDDSTIRVVLDEYGRGGLREWLTNDAAIASAEGKLTTSVYQNPDGLIDALQFWGNVQGKLLIEWGLKDDQVPDPTKEYYVEAWLIGNYVIKATLNYDPLHRKPYFKTSFEEIPGSFWGNSVCDLVRDAQTVCNAAARGIVNNMGIASGPQVVVNVDRVPPGEDLTQLYPWKIWQVNNDPTGNQQKPVDFFQPDSRVQELAMVFQNFAQMADEYSGIPKYLTGQTSGGAGRTASGLSMLIQNAGKVIKQVISQIDTHVLGPLIERLYYHNMRYATDPELKGDVNVVARGANSLIAKENAQVRRNEFLAATANPIDMQIVGVEGRAAVLREVAKGLDMDTDKIVPSAEVLHAKVAAANRAAAQQPPGGPEGPGGTPPNPTNNQQALQNGAPVADNFSPNQMTPQQ